MFPARFMLKWDRIVSDEQLTLCDDGIFAGVFIDEFLKVFANPGIVMV